MMRANTAVKMFRVKFQRGAHYQVREVRAMDARDAALVYFSLFRQAGDTLTFIREIE